MKRRRRPVRDQAESTFNIILEDLLALVPFARGAAIVDFEGETVDYAGELDPFELRVAGATFQLVLSEARTCKLVSPLQIVMPMKKAGFVIRVLDPSYCLIVVTRTLGVHCISGRLLLEIEARILHEAGLPIVRRPTSHRVEVETTGIGVRARPKQIRKPSSPIADDPSAAEPWVPVEVVGALVGTARGERAFRVRLPTGAETTLTYESSRLWFADDPIEALVRSNPHGRKLFLEPPASPAVKPPTRR